MQKAIFRSRLESTTCSEQSGQVVSKSPLESTNAVPKRAYIPICLEKGVGLLDKMLKNAGAVTILLATP